MSARWTHNALGGASRARCIEDIGRVIATHRNAWRGFNAFLYRVPIIIAPLDHVGHAFFALEHEHDVGFMFCNLNRAIDQGFIGHGAPRFQTARCGKDRLGCGIVDAHGQFVCRKTAEHNRVDCANTCTGQHRNQGFCDHGHVDDDAVTHCDAL